MIHAVFIDNDYGSLAVFEEICHQHEIQYTGIQNSDEVEKAIRRLSHIDIIFVDLEMPKHNGYEILQLLRSKLKVKTIPIVACTVHSDEMENTQNAGFSSFIIKPLNADRFAEQLLNVLQGQPVWETYSS